MNLVSLEEAISCYTTKKLKPNLSSNSVVSNHRMKNTIRNAILVLLFSVCARGVELKHVRRELQLECPPGITQTFNGPGDLSVTESRFSFLSVGSEGRAFISKLRSKDAQFYQDVLDNLIMFTCDVEGKEQDRCVPESSEFAAKTWNNECIVAAGHSCDEGTCERTSNCFWDKVQEGQVRKSRFTKDEYEASKEKLYSLNKDSYAGNLAIPTIAGIAVACVIFWLWVLYFMVRYCCCCLWKSCSICKSCSPIPREDGYSACVQWVMPTIVYVSCFIGLVTSGFTAIVGNEDIDEAATVCFAYASLLIENLRAFLVTTSMPLEELTSIVANAAQDALAIFDGTDYVRITANHIIQAFGDFIALHMVGFDGNEGALTEVQDTFVANVEPVVDQIQGMLDTLEGDLYDSSDMINSTLFTAVSQIGSLVENTEVWQTNVTTFEGIESEIRPMRLAAVLVFFLIGGAICLGGMVGIFAARRNKDSRLAAMIDLSSILSALLGSLCIVVASLTLLVSFLWHDVCEISSIVTNDFEPIMGETIAKGANAVFSGVNLAVAFNLTDRIDFEEKLNEGLAQIENVNITEQFELVLLPLEDIQTSIVDNVQSLSYTALGETFQTGIPSVCEFVYNWTMPDLTEPWDRPAMTTQWNLNSTGVPATEVRVNNESPEKYIDRLYSLAGMCDTSVGDCCLGADCTRVQNESCNSGSNCKREYSCELISQTVRTAFEKWHDANRMSANLGVECPSDLTCPTQEFQVIGNNDTLVELVSAYGENITDTAGSLVNIANTTVGDAMEQVQTFLCNMNITFVATGYEQVRDEVCGTMLGGFTQINFGLWSLGVCLETIAVIGAILATRLRGETKKEVSERWRDASFRQDKKVDVV